MNTPPPFSIGLLAQTACIWEVTARKPGNVHRWQDFEDATYLDFLLSAAAIATILDSAIQRPVGKTVLNGVQATRQVVRSNTNLGILLLLGPLASVPADMALRAGLEQVLDRLTVQDAREVYQAINMANPAGLGRVPEQDVSEEPTRNLREVMALAANRDLVALQYANGFQEVFEGAEVLRRAQKELPSLEDTIILCHLSFLAAHADSLLGRKRGQREALEASSMAKRTLEQGWPHTSAARQAFRDLDSWLRDPGHGRNPGATADLVAASLFVALREGIMSLPAEIPWSCSVGPGP